VSAASRPRLAVDLGTTWTAAAHGDGRSVELGPQGATMPSVVARDGDGFVVGHAAERVLATRPESGIREIKRRFGDTTPVVLDGQPYTPDALTVELLRGVASSAGVDRYWSPYYEIEARPIVRYGATIGSNITVNKDRPGGWYRPAVYRCTIG